jgi:hypothetical protein
LTQNIGDFELSHLTSTWSSQKLQQSKSSSGSETNLNRRNSIPHSQKIQRTRDENDLESTFKEKKKRREKGLSHLDLKLSWTGRLTTPSNRISQNPPNLVESCDGDMILQTKEPKSPTGDSRPSNDADGSQVQTLLSEKFSFNEVEVKFESGSTLTVESYMDFLSGMVLFRDLR